MVKQPAMEASEFQMSNEDFPALPGLSGPAPGQSAPAAPVPSSMDDLSGAPGALPNQLGGQPQGVIGSTISSSDMILQSTQQGRKNFNFLKKLLETTLLVQYCDFGTTSKWKGPELHLTGKKQKLRSVKTQIYLRKVPFI